MTAQPIEELPTDVDIETQEFVGWSVPSDAALDSIVRSTVATKLLDGLKNHEQIREELRRILSQGLDDGVNPVTVGRTAQKALEDYLQTTRARMVTIARTEMLDAYRQGAALTQQANSEVLAGWVWMSSLSERTCPACISMHGTVHDLSEPGPDDHPNGACYRMPLTKTWKELGFKDIPEPSLVVPDKEQWFESLSELQQKQILGPSRYDLWVNGQYPMSAWATSRANPGWRRSYIPSPAIPLKHKRQRVI